MIEVKDTHPDEMFKGFVLRAKRTAGDTDESIGALCVADVVRAERIFLKKKRAMLTL